MTQPPLSRQLRELEEELGTALFIRGSKKITLTEDGLLLRRRAEELVELMEKTRAELHSSRDHIRGDIYIGSGETDAISVLAQVAGQLKKRHPLIHYHLYSGDAERVRERLDKGLIDFGLFIGPVDISKYDCMRLPLEDTWGVLMRRDCPLAEKGEVCPGDLRDQPLILSHQAADSEEMFSWLASDASQLNIVTTYDLIYNASHFVRQGIGLAITLDKLVRTDGDSGLCFRPLAPALKAGLCLAWKKYPVFSKASRAFLEQLKQALALESGKGRM